MAYQRRVLGMVAFVLGLAVLIYREPPPQIDKPTPTDRSQLRSELRRQWYQQEETGLAYYHQDALPTPKAVMAEDDINALLANTPTAAGLKPLLELQYHAASQGEYPEAMRFMAESFIQGRGTGSYQESW